MPGCQAPKIVNSYSGNSRQDYSLPTWPEEAPSCHLIEMISIISQKGIVILVPKFLAKPMWAIRALGSFVATNGC